MARELTEVLTVAIFRIATLFLIVLVKFFVDVYKYNKKIRGHYESLLITLYLTDVTQAREVEQLQSLFETIKTDKISFEKTTLIMNSNLKKKENSEDENDDE